MCTIYISQGKVFIPNDCDVLKWYCLVLNVYTATCCFFIYVNMCKYVDKKF